MIIAAASDLHGFLPDPPIGKIDLIILAGDICPDLRPIERQADWLDSPKFRWWLRDLEATKGVPVYGTWGNHDFAPYRSLAPKDLPFIVDDEILPIQDQSIYFTPWVPNLGRWAFSYPEDVPEAKREEIPQNIDILVSHGPPFGLMDRVVGFPNQSHVGSKSLLDACLVKRPRIIICGHIHEARGMCGTEWGGRVYNVASLDRSYQPYRESWTYIEV